MMIPPKLLSLESDCLSEAAIWYGQLHAETVDETTWTKFLIWLESDPAHSTAFDQIEDLYAELDEAGPPLIAKLDQPSTITSLNAWRNLRRPRVSRLAAGALGLMAASIIVVLGFGRSHMTTGITEYATRIGETKKVALGDGSIIEMNTGSALTVTYSATQRQIRLDKGEALFRVAKDLSRPFILTVGDREVRDLGTVYNVLRVPGQVTVTVTEGMVAVSPHVGLVQSADDLAVQLSPGEQLVFLDGASKPTVRQIDTEAVLAWRQGYVTFKDAPMSQVTSDLNRYFTHQIVLKDRDIAARRFSGVLKIDNEDAVLKRLTELMPVLAERSSDGSIDLRLKP